MAQKFFDEREDQSEVKARIVTKYFYAWAKIMIANAKRYSSEKKIAYLDLFAGPGRYKDGAASTPLMVLGKAIEDPELREMLVSIFNDENPDHSANLQEEVKKLKSVKMPNMNP